MPDDKLLEQQRTSVRGRWPYTDEAVEELRHLYVDRGMTTGEVGRTMGASAMTVYRAVRRLGITRGRSEAVRAGLAKMTPEAKEAQRRRMSEAQRRAWAQRRGEAS